jgi:REP element-mobilizing transposase RayT
MARKARGESIDPSKIQMVHVYNRCVRRAFLCGKDLVTGRDFEHRRQWARDRLEHLASVFAIDCVTFSIMSNHTHQILRSRPDIVATWDDETVAQRWLRLTPKRNQDGDEIQPTQYEVNRIVNDSELLSQIRFRLSDVSWWMRYFSQNIACRANREDEVTGHFWEGRFGSELIESEASILTCMIYVDLNPVRAAIAQTPEESDFTGAKERIDDLRIELATGADGVMNLNLQSNEHSVHDWERLDNQHSGWMCPIEIDEANDNIGPDPEFNGRRVSRKGVFAISLTRYLELLDWVGRQLRGDKRGAIPVGLAPILSRVGLTAKSVLQSAAGFGSIASVDGSLSGFTEPWPVPG